MAKKLIINADDYGLDDNINQAIISLAQLGAITSTSVMANFATDKSIIQLKQTSISTGLHLNLIEGRPVSDLSRVRSLVDDQGNFLSWYQLLVGFIFNKVKKSELEIEIASQLELLQHKGLTISHADSHKHIHQYPLLGPFILQTFSRLGITRVRNCSPSNWKHQRMLVLAVFCIVTRNTLTPFITPQRLITNFSVNKDGHYNDFMEELSKSFEQYDLLEIMTHPGLQDRVDSYLNRKSEYEYLKDIFFQQMDRLKNVELISYLGI